MGAWKRHVGRSSLVVPKWQFVGGLVCLFLLLFVDIRLLWEPGNVATELATQLLGAILTGVVVTTVVNLIIRSWLRPERWEVLLGQAGAHAVYPYTREGREARDRREVELLERARTIDLLAITGATYLNDTGVLARAFRGAISRGARVRVLLLDPASDAARWRGARESGFMPADYDWAHHKDGVLYQRHQLSVASSLTESEDGHVGPELRFYTPSPSCSFLLLDEAVLIDLYHFGRKDKDLPDGLGEDYPVFEYCRTDSGIATYQLARSHFEWLWKNSLSSKVYKDRDTISEWEEGVSPAERYRLVRTQDSWVAVDPVVGCPNGCGYCVLRSRSLTPHEPVWLYTDVRRVVEIVKRSSGSHSKIPLAIGNMTELFLPNNATLACKMVEGLAEAFPGRTICVPTKGEIERRHLKALKPYRSQLVFFVSLSGLGPSQEPRIARESVEATLEGLADREFRVVHYWRPVTQENSSLECVESVLSAVRGKALASVVRGQKLPGGPLDTVPGIFWQHLQHANAEDRTRVSHPVYLHTSCAISLLQNDGDYNATQWHPQACAKSNAAVKCPEGQQRLCLEAAKGVVGKSDVWSALQALRPRLLERDVEISVGDDAVRLKGVILSDEEYRTLLHTVRRPILCDIRSEDIWHSSIFANGCAMR